MSEEGARLMAEMADGVYQAGHTLMLEMIDGSDLSERRKIGAAMTAVTLLYESMLDACEKVKREDTDNLMLGLFMAHLSPKLTAMAKRKASRKG